LQHRTRRLAAALVAAAIASIVLSSVPPASAARDQGKQHCVIEVIETKPDGEMVTTHPRCHARFADAMADTGVRGAERLREGGSSSDLQAVAASSSTFVIGTHYDGASLTGSSISVVGSDCNGGWLNLSWSWKNRISSTANGCFRITHWDYDNLQGAWEDTLGFGGNLIGLNDKTNSVQYRR
jgi:hypothetical protein